MKKLPLQLQCFPFFDYLTLENNLNHLLISNTKIALVDKVVLLNEYLKD